MTVRREGMDHPHYTYSAMPARPPLIWPGAAPLAVSVVLYFEHWELEPSDAAFRDPRFGDINGSFVPDQFLYSIREYGNRVGVFRVLDALDRHGLKATVAANAVACERYPFLVDAFLKRGYEIAAHGLSATQMITGRMGVNEEREFIGETLRRIERSTGRRPTGWIGQDFGESSRTPELLADAGLAYVMDWPNDEQPYAMAAGRLVSVPNQAEWDDIQLLWHRRAGAPRYAAAVCAAADRLHADGAVSGRFLGLGIHPWMLGTPGRIRYLEQALDHVMGLPKIWSPPAEEVARHTLVTSAPRVGTGG